MTAPAPSASPAAPADRGVLAIALILAGMVFISVNDMVMKRLSGDYALHQLVFMRSALGICISLAILRFEGGYRLLRTRRPGLHLLRGLLIVVANMAFFTALSVLPLAMVTAIFFVAPLLITLLAIPVLGETVGAHRLAAVLVGFAGVLVMVRPGVADRFDVAPWVLALPILSAACYAGMQVLTRKLGADMPASGLAIYIQAMFLAVSAAFWLAAGDGRFAERVEGETLTFLLRAWRWPDAADWGWFAAIGLASSGIAYCLSAAYRLGDAATIAPFEYVALPLAIFWGWLIFGEFPEPVTLLGIALIGASGVHVFLRERALRRRVATDRPTRRT